MKCYQKLFIIWITLVLMWSLIPTVFAEADDTVKYTSDTMRIAVINGKTQVTVSNLESNCTGKTVICSWYKNKRLVDIRYGIYNGIQAIITSEVLEYDKIQFFVWDSLMGGKSERKAEVVDAPDWIDKKVSTEKISLTMFKSINRSASKYKIIFSHENGSDIVYTIASDAKIFYNGKPLIDIPIEKCFGNGSETNYMIVPDGSRMGTVTLIDQENTVGYDTVEIEVGFPAVVSENTDGNIVFMNSVTVPVWQPTTESFETRSVSSIPIDSTITKAGFTYDPAQLKKNDVIIMKPNIDNTGYQVEVLGSESCIKSYITSTASNGKVNLRNGKWRTLSDGSKVWQIENISYTVDADNGYCTVGLKLGDSGTFYIWNNRIVAFLNSGFTDSTDYGYVINAAVSEKGWGEKEILIKLITQKNKIQILSIAMREFSLHNLDSIDDDLATELVAVSYSNDKSNITLNMNNLSTNVIQSLADIMINHLVSYVVADDGTISEIYFEQSSDEEDNMYFETSKTGAYNANNQTIGDYKLEADMPIFFITGQDEEVTYGGTVVADADDCGVGTAADLIDNAIYSYIGFYSTGCNALVIMNTPAQIPATEVEDAEEQTKVLTAENNYGYFINTTMSKGVWGNVDILTQLLDESGEIYEAAVADGAVLKNVDKINSSLATELNCDADGTATLNLAETNLSVLCTLADTMVNNLVTYSSNSDGCISEIIFAQNADEDAGMYLADSQTSAYDEKEMIIGSIEVDKDTLVFYISNLESSGTVVYGTNKSIADPYYSRVADGTDLAEAYYTYVAFDTGDGTADAIVIMNTMGKISPVSNVAVIQSIGMAERDGYDVYLVEYYTDGELKIATTAPDLIEFYDAAEGDVYQLKLIDGKIAKAMKLVDYSRTIGEKAENNAYFNNNVVFGAITAISEKGNLSLSDGNIIPASDAKTANVYVLDPNREKGKQIYVGTIEDAYVDENLTTNDGLKVAVEYKYSGIYDKLITINTADLSNVYELLDYAFAYSYDGTAIDIVIYKPYDFDYSLVSE